MFENTSRLLLGKIPSNSNPNALIILAGVMGVVIIIACICSFCETKQEKPTHKE